MLPAVNAKPPTDVLLSDIAVLGQACYERGGSNDWVSACNPQKSKLSASSANVLTTWLMP